MQALLKLVMNKVVALILSFGALLSIMTGGLVKIPDGVLPEIPDDPPAAQVEIFPGAMRVASFNVQTAGEGENFFLFRIRAVSEQSKIMRPHFHRLAGGAPWLAACSSGGAACLCLCGHWPGWLCVR